MQSALYEAEHEAFRAMVRDFLAKEVVPHHAAWEEAGVVDRYEVTETRTCFYTVTDDERFVAHREDRVLALSPCSGHGFNSSKAATRNTCANAQATCQRCAFR